MSSSNDTAVQQTTGQKDGREVEWQLASTDLGSVRRWLTEHGTIDGLVLEPRSTLQIVDTYLDTEDWRIHRAGYALRIRSESGKSEATLKSLHAAGAEPADRRELSEPLANSESDSICRAIGPVGTRVHAVSGAHALLPLFEVRTSRQRFAIRREDAVQQLGEIALDETVIARPHGEPRTSMQRVEVEALTTPHEPLRSLVKTMQSDCALAVATETKYTQGLKSVGLAPGPAPGFEPTAIDASMPIVDIALANLRRYLSAWHLHEPGARLGDDPEELHDLRVAARRLDAIVREFLPSLPAAFRGFRPPLKKILRALGEARDLDVALSELDSFAGSLPEPERHSVEPLKQHLAAERRRARARMLSVLDSAAVQENLQTLTALLAAPSGGGQQRSPEPALNVAPQLIRRRYRKLRKEADQLTPDSSMEDYHAVRDHVKKLRYVLEAMADIFGKPAAQMLRALCRWQEQLGVQQDAAVASRRLKALAGAPPKGMPPETLFLMGRLAEHYTSVTGRARKVHAKGYRKIRERWKRLRARFAESAAGDETPDTGAGG
jgi:CHAD domain-containing protein